MKTAVVMKRELFGMTVSQNSKTEYFSATDLIRAGNSWRLLNGLPAFNDKSWFKNKGTVEYIEEIEKRHGKAKISARGRGQHTWIHPLLFIDMALSISPKLKIEAYSWMFDHLIKYRNDSGDSYKIMCGCLFAHSKNKVNFYQYVREVAGKIKLACHVKDWNEATEDQLKLRDKLHNNIGLLSDVLNNNEEAVRIAILKAVKS